MIKNLGTIRLVFLALFAVLTIASWTYSYAVVKPRQQCEAAGRWWDEQGHQCGIPVSVSRFTGRPTPAEAAAAAKPQGQRTSGGSELRIDSTLPPVFRPKMVPRS